MGIDIDTGKIGVPRVPNRHDHLNGFVGTIIESNDTTPSEFLLYPSQERRMVVIEPNTMAVITGYNLHKDTKVMFSKILRSGGTPALGSADCCPSITISHAIKLHSATIHCWKLDECNPMFVIKTPGMYEIDVVGDIAEVVVTSTKFPIQDINDFTPCECVITP